MPPVGRPADGTPPEDRNRPPDSRAGGLGSARASVGPGLRLAVTTLTIVPLPPGRIDRAVGRAAMVAAPLVGAALGAGVAGVLAGLTAAGAGALLAAVLAVALLAVGTRGLHLDGLADTADGLGSGAPAERALAVMRSPEVGPFGVATLVLVLLGQVAAVAELAAADRWFAAALAVGVGRLGITWACRRGVPAARPDGLGALVAGSVPPAGYLLASVPAAVAGVFAVPGRPLQGVLAVAAAVGVAVAVTAHVRRRLGGISGDTLGAATEVATLTAWVGFAF